MTELQLLEEYKNYSYLNADTNPLVKIFLGYIKPEFLFSSNILTPIHLGRDVAKDISKEGIIDDNSLEWLMTHCIGDDDFIGNISHINRRVGLFTGTYWAWKNYEKLNNPQYFGSFGYRKILPADCLKNLEEYDLIIPAKELAEPNIKEHLIKLHGSWLYEGLKEAISALYPEDLDEMENYFAMNKSYCHEIYIMKRDVFFEYCEWIYPLLQYFLDLDFTKYPRKKVDEESLFLKLFDLKNEKRDIAYIMERITGYYLYKLTLRHDIKYRELGIISFANDTNERKMNNKLISAMLRKKIYNGK